MIRKTYVISMAGACLLLSLGAASFYLSGPAQNADKQDNCEFGTVTNNEYRELLIRARQLSKGREAELQGDQTAIGSEIKSRVEELAAGTESIYFRLASMHAALRAIGGRFAGGGADQFKVWDSNFSRTRPINSQGSVLYFYSVPLSTFGRYSISYSDASIVINLSILRENDRVKSAGIRRNGDFSATVNIPAIIKTLLKGDRPPQKSETELGCPPVPSFEWAAAFDAWRTTLPGDTK